VLHGPGRRFVVSSGRARFSSRPIDGQNRTTGAVAIIAQGVAKLLADHVRLTVEGIDRLYLNVSCRSCKRLQSGDLFCDHRGQPLASAALMG
jgi:hypothetical protein